MTNFKEVLIEALKRNKGKDFFGVNKGLMEVSLSTKKKPAFVKVAVSDEAARNFMSRKYTGFIICFDGDELNEIVDELDKLPQAIETTE